LVLDVVGYLTSSLEKVGLTYILEVIYCLSYLLLVEVFLVFWQIIFVTARLRSHLTLLQSALIGTAHGFMQNGMLRKKNILQKLNMMVIKHFHKHWIGSVSWISFFMKNWSGWMKDNRAWSWRKTLGREHTVVAQHASSLLGVVQKKLYFSWKRTIVNRIWVFDYSPRQHSNLIKSKWISSDV
jgi:hypothetical protein